MSDYKRLTKNKPYEELDLINELGYSHIYKRLQELENKIENGTLVEVGYLIEKGVKNHDDQRYNIVEVVYKEYLLYMNLTKAEAEKKLKEIKGKV